MDLERGLDRWVRMTKKPHILLPGSNFKCWEREDTPWSALSFSRFVLLLLQCPHEYLVEIQRPQTASAPNDNLLQQSSKDGLILTLVNYTDILYILIVSLFMCILNPYNVININHMYYMILFYLFMIACIIWCLSRISLTHPPSCCIEDYLTCCAAASHSPERLGLSWMFFDACEWHVKYHTGLASLWYFSSAKSTE